MKYLKPLFFLVATCVLAFNLPSLHYHYVRHVVGKTIVKIWAPGHRGGGTGFHIKSPKGNVYILTNSHVCEVSSDGLNIDVETAEGRDIKRRIIENSGNTDLCLIEGVPNAQYLTLGKEANPGDILAVVGHPELMANTMTRGEVIEKMEVKIPVSEIVTDADRNKCTLPKNSIEKFFTFFGPVEVCMSKVKAIMTTIPILPGSSGSPVIDLWGNVCGVVFAGNRANWAAAVQFGEVKTFLEPY